MNEQEFKLIEPNAELKAEFFAMAEEFSASGDDKLKSAAEDFDAYLEHLAIFARGINLPPNRVTQTTFWLARGDRIFGESNLRPHLNDSLRIEGGNIGYAIRPSERRKGYGTLILKLTLEKAKNRGLNRVLVTCDTDNIGSAKIIEKNGGVPEGQAISPTSGKQISQYWIEIK
jgi:predicted acetyltransferase